ncbi:MAG: polyprenol monophosphomannose synthase [Lachnospiraceae bacterium]|jgi:dolichol-phosphate mannosyltransferase|nr:polyprenol monophosphomannose synthase [Lachnospiraceae bacterium]
MLSIVIPTFNEKGNIKPLLKQIAEALKDISYEIIFVDDSNDETPNIILKEMKKTDNIKLEHRENKSGLATAVIRGFELSQGEYIAVIDADLQHPPRTLYQMYQALEKGKGDICIPSRFIKGGSDGGLNIYRKFVSGTARWLGKIILPCLRKVSDPTSGLFMFRREIIKNSELKPIGWKIMIEVLAMGHYSKIIEIPYKFCKRNEGESKLNINVTIDYIKQLFHLKKRYIKNKITIEHQFDIK